MIVASALTCLALNVYHEARGEPLRGQQAVAMVTLNRAQWDQSNVCKVVYQRKQFSWTHTIRDPRPKDSQAWELALTVSHQALTQAADTVTRGATFYHATYVSPRWAVSMQPVARIGAHIFYRGGKASHRSTRRSSLLEPALPGRAPSATDWWLRSFVTSRTRLSLDRINAVWAQSKRNSDGTSSTSGSFTPRTSSRSFLCTNPRRTGSHGPPAIRLASIDFAFDRRRPSRAGAINCVA